MVFPDHTYFFIVTDSSHALDDFPGFPQGDISTGSDIKDLFNDLFYHVFC